MYVFSTGWGVVENGPENGSENGSGGSENGSENGSDGSENGSDGSENGSDGSDNRFGWKMCFLIKFDDFGMIFVFLCNFWWFWYDFGMIFIVSASRSPPGREL